MNTTLLKLIAIGALIAGTGWWAYSEGASDCEQAHTRAALKASREAAERDTGSLTLGKETTDKAAETVSKINEAAQEAAAEVRVVYRDIVRTVPLADSCVHPIDPRVQGRIEQAVNAANAAITEE